MLDAIALNERVQNEKWKCWCFGLSQAETTKRVDKLVRRENDRQR